MPFAEKTTVSPERSRGEIEKILSRYGATDFAYAYRSGGGATVAFRMVGRNVRFVMPLPPLEEFKWSPGRRPRRRNPGQMKEAQGQEIRRRWRALALTIKAKLESVESGITTFDREFLAHIMLPGGQDAGEFLVPQIQEAYESGKMPKLLPAAVD